MVGRQDSGSTEERSPRGAGPHNQGRESMFASECAPSPRKGGAFDVRRRERSATYDLKAYSEFRRAELAARVAEDRVAANAALAFDMHLPDVAESTGVNKTGTLFFTDDARLHGVAVLFMPSRQEVDVRDASVSLRLNPWENEDAAERAFETYGIFDAQAIRPSVSRVQNVFTQSKDGLFQNVRPGTDVPMTKKQRKKNKERFGDDFDEWVRKQAKTTPSRSSGTSGTSGTSGASTPSRGANACAASPLRRTSSGQIIADLSSASRASDSSITTRLTDVSNKIVSFQFEGCQYTVFSSPVRDDLHVDISPRSVWQFARDVVEYPHAHHPFEWYRTREGNTMKRAAYGNLHKKEWVLKSGRTVEVRTFRQIREQDLRHIERLENEHAWTRFFAKIAPRKIAP